MKRLSAHHLSFLFFSALIFIGCSKPKENVTDTKPPTSEPSAPKDPVTDSDPTPKKPEDSTNSNPGTPIAKPQPRLITDATIASHLASTAGKPFGQLTEDELQAFRNLDLQGRK